MSSAFQVVLQHAGGSTFFFSFLDFSPFSAKNRESNIKKQNPSFFSSLSSKFVLFHLVIFILTSKFNRSVVLIVTFQHMAFLQTF